MERKTSVNSALHTIHSPLFLHGYKKYYSLMYVYPFCVYLYYNEYDVSNLK